MDIGYNDQRACSKGHITCLGIKLGKNINQMITLLGCSIGSKDAPKKLYNPRSLGGSTKRVKFSVSGIAYRAYLK